MKGKKGLVMGVANDRSIAWGIAKKIASESFQGSKIVLINNPYFIDLRSRYSKIKLNSKY